MYCASGYGLLFFCAKISVFIEKVVIAVIAVVVMSILGSSGNNIHLNWPLHTI